MHTHIFHKDDAGSGGIPTRNQARLEDTWDLTLLYPAPSDWQSAFEKLQKDYPRSEKWKGRAGESARTLAEVARV